MTCKICCRQSRGFGWFNPLYPIGDPRRDASRVWFCSKHCQDLFVQRLSPGGFVMVDPTELEQAAMAAALVPLGEIVTEIGMDKPMADYSKEQVLTLIEVVVTAYQDHMRETDKPDDLEVPF